MIILLHVIVALASLAVSTVAYIRPSRSLLGWSYGLVGATFLTGTYLVVTAPAHILETCLMGLFYLGLVSVGTVGARLKLATQERTTAHLD